MKRAFSLVPVSKASYDFLIFSFSIFFSLYSVLLFLSNLLYSNLLSKYSESFEAFWSKQRALRALQVSSNHGFVLFVYFFLVFEVSDNNIFNNIKCIIYFSSFD